MNDDDMKLLSMLLRYSRRRMVAVVAQVAAHLRRDEGFARDALGRLERLGFLYVDGPTVRLTMAGFAHAIAHTAVAPVHRLRRRASSLSPSRAA